MLLLTNRLQQHVVLFLPNYLTAEPVVVLLMTNRLQQHVVLLLPNYLTAAPVVALLLSITKQMSLNGAVVV